MKKIKVSWNHGALGFTLALLALFCMVPTVHAQSGMVYGDSVPAGQTVQGDIILAGTDVKVDGTVAGDLIAVGQNITVNGTVEGSLIAIGSKVIINGTVQGTTYIASVTTVLGEKGSLQRNLYDSGVSLVMKTGSVIGRDLFALVFGSTSQGEITGRTQAVVGPYEVFKLIIDQLKINLQLPATLSPTSFQGGAGGGRVLLDTRQAASDTTGQFLSGLAAWGMPVVQDLVPLFIVGLILIWLMPNLVSKGSKHIRTRPWYTLGVGLLIFVISLNIVGVVLLLAALIFIIGLGFGFLSLWGLAAIWWVLALLALGLAAALFFVMVFFGSRVVISYLLGGLILRKVGETSFLHRLGILSLGMLVFVLVASIPVFGWVASVVAVSFGLGGIWLAYREQRVERKWVAETAAKAAADIQEPLPPVEPAAEAPAGEVKKKAAPKPKTEPEKKTSVPKK
jgi:cytoskeletal protein CcmA (bactofilin family)